MFIVKNNVEQSPAEAVCAASTVNCFKGLLDRYWGSCCFVVGSGYVHQKENDQPRFGGCRSRFIANKPPGG